MIRITYLGHTIILLEIHFLILATTFSKRNNSGQCLFDDHAFFITINIYIIEAFAVCLNRFLTAKLSETKDGNNIVKLQ